jgi:hypothetical protein
VKNPILRILIRAAFFSLVSSTVVMITGLILNWKTPTQFSDGFFWAGGIMIAIGFLNVYAMYNQDGIAGLQYSLKNPSDRDEGFKLWMSDTLRGYNLLAFLGTSGFLLLVMAGLIILVGKLF